MISTALLLGGLQDPSIASPATAVSAEPAKVTDRPDRVSAMVAARTQKSRVEDLSARTPTSETFANPDGTWTTESYSGVVRSKGADDKWVPIDPSLTHRDGAVEPKAVPLDVAFSDGADKVVGKVDAPGAGAISVGWPNRLPSPEIDGTNLTYPDVAPNSDLVVESHADGFNFSVLLDQRPTADAAPLEYRFPLTFKGVTPDLKPDGSIVVKDGKDQVATITAPVMWDSSAPDENGLRAQQPVTAALEGTGDARTLVLRPSMDYLRDPNTVLPVTIDPTVVFGVGADTWVNSLGPTASQDSSTELVVGSNSLGVSKSRSFMTFDFTSLSSVPGFVVTNASVQLSNFATGACTGTAVRMSRVTGSWTSGALTWANQPAVTATGSSTSTGSFGAAACPAEGVVTFDATAIATAWFNEAAPQYGVQFAAVNEGVASGYRKFRSIENGDATKAPKMVLTYNAYPSVPTGLTVTPGVNGYASSLTPTLSAVVTDPDGGATRGFFEVKSGSTVVWSGSSPMATSGARVEVTVPSGILTDGSTYTVNAYSQDSSLKSQTAATLTRQTDVTAPTVAITASAFTENVWATTTPASSTFTFNGVADTHNFSMKFDGNPLGAQVANSSGDLTTSAWVPTPGWHTWEITPVDKAGNQGTPTTFSFGAGAAGFITPVQWTQSTSAFPVAMAAPPNATSASVQWRLWGETTWRSGTKLTNAGAPWSGTVTTAGGRSSTPDLVWTATAETFGTGTLTAPANLEIRGCFQYAASADSCTTPRVLLLVASALGGNYPVTDLGPAKVGLFTGEASIGTVDAADSKAGVTRTFNSFDAATLTVGVFGPGWSQPGIMTAPSPDAKATVVDNRAKDGSFVIIDPDSGSQTFVPVSGSSTAFVPTQPTGDATQLTYAPADGTSPARLDLVRPLGTGSLKTTWTLKTSDTGGPSAWTVDAVDAPGTASDVAISSAGQRPTFVRESDASASATCNATTQTVGCRGLKVAYSGTGAATRVSSVSRVIGAAAQSAVTTTTLATYGYDSAGTLTSVCTPAPAAGKPQLCTNYAYTTINGRTLLSESKPAGLKAWRFSYDSIGRLSSVKREKPEGGDATWSVDYNLAITAAGLPSLTASSVATWGQTSVPTKVIAVYQPHVGTTDVSKAQLYYTTSNGTTTNTATYGSTGWLVGTSWYDARGHVVQQLDGAGWARAQAAPTADRLRVAGEASSYTTYNTWGDADTIGTRVVDEYGPAHTASLQDGTIGLFRTHSKNTYDDDPNVDAALVATRPGTAGLGLVVKTTTSTTNAARTTDSDSKVVIYGYEPIVAGDGNGWALGSPTSAKTQASPTSWSVEITRFDTSGREIESRRPGGTADSNGAGADAHSTVTSYYTASGSGDCGGKPAWDGLLCKTGPAGQPSGPTIPTTHHTAYNDALLPTSVQETSGATTRTTSTGYDDLSRPTTVTRVTAGSGVTNGTISTTYGYDDNTGLPTTTTAVSGGATITVGYDSWGRVTNYTDALGTASSTTYAADGQVATKGDGTATYTYGYDARGELSSVNGGGGVGSYTYTYTPAGSLDTLTYPNGVISKRSYDEIGTVTGLTYAQGATQLLTFSATTLADGRTVSASSPASAQRLGYDDLGRLTSVQDTRPTGCTTRTYGFDASSNRDSFASYNAGPAGACQTATAATNKTSSYDSAGRITNAGYTYDTFGRTLTTPQSDAGLGAAGTLTASYHPNNMIATTSLTVFNATGGTDAKTMSYGLDASERIHTITAISNGTESERLRYRFMGTSDSPATVERSTDGGSTWASTRYVNLPEVGVVASTTAGVTEAQLVNLHGDLVATMPNTVGTGVVDSYRESDEYGNTNFPARYGWLGSKQRSTDNLGGGVLMGSRVYNPSTGAFSSPDPVRDGNATPYTYPQDPINSDDLDGQRRAQKCRCDRFNKYWNMWTLTGIAWGKWKKTSKPSVVHLGDYYDYKTPLTAYKVRYGLQFSVQRRCTKDGYWQYRTGWRETGQYKVQVSIDTKVFGTFGSWWNKLRIEYYDFVWFWYYY